MPPKLPLPLIALLLLAAGCSKLDNIGKVPPLSPAQGSDEYNAMATPSLPQQVGLRRNADTASLWSAGRKSLLGDRRAVQRGDILTVVIEIDDKAEISNSTARNR